MAGVLKQKPCRYGAKCYRRNAQHLEEYSHPTDQNEETKAPPKKKPKVADESETPKKKKTIEDFFKKNSKEDTTETTKTAAGGTGNTSGYVREDSPVKRRSEPSTSELQQDAEETMESDEDEVAPDSPTNTRENIKSKFLVDMPEDFYHFWDFANSVRSTDPINAFKKTLNLQLVGPFDVLAGRCVKRNSLGRRPNYLRHWRYYYDPPEFLTVIRGDDESQFHFGYFRDDPREMPVFVASNAAKDNGTITPRGENIFAAVNWYIEDCMKKDDSKDERLSKLKDDLATCAKEHSYSLDLRTKGMRDRDKKMNSKTFHGAGLVVPVDKNEVGYRELPETTGDLKKMFRRIADASSESDRDKAMDGLMDIISLIQFANDECDYGEGLELGLDLFTFGGKVFHKTILSLLPLAYELLGRKEYKAVIEAHLRDRRRTANLSQLN